MGIPATPSSTASEVSQRKAEHLRLTARGNADTGSAGWADVNLSHEAVPAFDLQDVDTTVVFLGRRLTLPLVISAMTGGHAAAETVNAALARAAERCGCAMGVGSQRAAIENSELAATYRIARDRAPHAFLIANIGLSQLVPQFGDRPLTIGHLDRVVEMIEAQALAVHLNLLQECVQPEGQTKMSGAIPALASVVRRVGVPVIAKETGSEMTRSTAVRLRDAGAAALDVGGRGGTSFALVESRRARERGDASRERLGEVFANWGIPTPVSLIETAGLGIPVIATGGIRSGLDAARALALGATLVGVARPLLQAALRGEEAVVAWIEQFTLELRTAMFLCGAPSVQDLRGRAVVTGTTLEWVRQRQGANGPPPQRSERSQGQRPNRKK